MKCTMSLFLSGAMVASMAVGLGCNGTADSGALGADAATVDAVVDVPVDVATGLPDNPATPDVISGVDVPLVEDVPTVPDLGHDSGPVPPGCSSGVMWTLGDKESPLMHPGGDCIGCHVTKKDAPPLQFGGTVYPTLSEKNDCNGSASVTVEVTDSKGQVVSRQTNAAGNFYLKSEESPTLVFPITAKVLSKGQERKMFSPQSTGACNSCHGSPPIAGAPGRIMTP